MFFIKWDDCIFRQMFRVIFDKHISNKTRNFDRKFIALHKVPPVARISNFDKNIK